MEEKNIILNHTLEQYNKKYRNRRFRLLKISKKEVEEFDKKNPTYIKKYLLAGRKWWLIKDTYYEIPKPIRFTWFRNLNAGAQTAICLLGAGVVATAITVPLVVLNNQAEPEVSIDSVDKVEWSNKHYDKDGNACLTIKGKNGNVIQSVTVTIENYLCIENIDYTYSASSGELKVMKACIDTHPGKINITPNFEIPAKDLTKAEWVTKANELNAIFINSTKEYTKEQISNVSIYTKSGFNKMAYTGSVGVDRKFALSNDESKGEFASKKTSGTAFEPFISNETEGGHYKLNGDGSIEYSTDNVPKTNKWYKAIKINKFGYITYCDQYYTGTSIGTLEATYTGEPHEPSVIHVTGVTVKKTANLLVTKTETLTATVAPSNATNKKVTWSSDKPAVATVDTNTGLVTAVAEGTAKITATTEDGGFTSSCDVNVSSFSSEGLTYTRIGQTNTCSVGYDGTTTLFKNLLIPDKDPNNGWSVTETDTGIFMAPFAALEKIKFSSSLNKINPKFTATLISDNTELIFEDDESTWTIEHENTDKGIAKHVVTSTFKPNSDQANARLYLHGNDSYDKYTWTKNIVEDLPTYLNAETVGQEEDNTIKVSYSGTGTLPATLEIKSKYKVNGVEKTVIEINNRGFYENQDIEKIIIGKEIKKIGTTAFCGCSKVNEVTFEENSKLTDLDYACFAGLSSNLKTFTIPKQVNNIDNPFERDFGLTNFVVLSDNFTTILNGSALVSVDKKILYSYPTANGELDFSKGDLNTIEILASHSLNNVINITNIIFSNKITKIGDFSCVYLRGLNPSSSTITIPSSVKEIGSLAFLSLPSSITKIHFDDANGWHIKDLSGQTIDLSNDTDNKYYFSDSYQQTLKLVKA